MKHIIALFLALAATAAGQNITSIAATGNGSTINAATDTLLYSAGNSSGNATLRRLSFAELANVPGLSFSSNQTLDTITGNLSLSRLAQDGATANQTLTWNGTVWAPATPATDGGNVTNSSVNLAISENATATRDVLSAAQVGNASKVLDRSHRDDSKQGLMPLTLSDINNSATNQARIFLMGDSLVGNGFWSAFYNVIDREVGVAGVGPGYTAARTLAGGASEVTTGDVWFNTVSVVIPVGGSAVYQTAGGTALSLLGDTIKVHYVKDVGGGNMTITTSTDNGATWSAAEAVVDTSNATQIGAVEALAVKAEPDWYAVKVENTGASGSVRVIGVEIVNSKKPGVVLMGAWRGGNTVTAESAANPAVIQPIMAALAPDAIIHYNTDDTINYTNDFPVLHSNIKPALPNVEWVKIGIHPLENQIKADPQNAEIRRLCSTLGMSFIANLAEYSYDEINAMGLMAINAITGTVTANSGTDVFTRSSHGMNAGSPMRFTGTLPPEMAVGTIYYAINLTSSTFKVAASRADALAGTAIDISTNGSGMTVFSDVGVASAGDDTIFRTTSQFVGGWAVTLTSTGTLPAPLQPRTTYYITVIDGSTLKLSTSQDNKTAGVFVDITDAGSGIHTVNKSDFVHPSSEGFEVMASNVWSQTPLHNSVGSPIFRGAMLSNPTYLWPPSRTINSLIDIKRNPNAAMTLRMSNIGGNLTGALSLNTLSNTDATRPGHTDLRNASNTTLVTLDPATGSLGFNTPALPGRVKHVFGSSISRVPVRIVQPSGTANWLDGTTSANLDTATVGWRITQAGSFEASTAGQGIIIKGGSNAKVGNLTLSAGNATISNNSTTSNSLIFLSPTGIGTSAELGVRQVITKTAGTGFSVSSLLGNATVALSDNSTFDYLIIERLP